eukprot:TRINITY_DN31715_c0_g1_i1.p2 TRINITY_DN31715_c0_g1~~TRINITY_DN31715_c0_g1_i1.p2  ORF type:complete len:101 (-),score=2.56 TRINITY_DN31715_c0_g1_i1:863-1165(-)
MGRFLQEPPSLQIVSMSADCADELAIDSALGQRRCQRSLPPQWQRMGSARVHLGGFLIGHSMVCRQNLSVSSDILDKLSPLWTWQATRKTAAGLLGGTDI